QVARVPSARQGGCVRSVHGREIMVPRQRAGVLEATRGIILAIVPLALACQKEAPPVVVTPPTVTVSKPLEKEILNYDAFTARLGAVDAFDVRARVRGYIDEVNFVDGELVEQGKVLFQIDPRPYAADLKAAESQVDVWKAKEAKAQADVKRFTDLVPKGAASQQDLDRSTAEASEAAGMIQTNLAAVDQAQLNLGFTKVSAP